MPATKLLKQLRKATKQGKREQPPGYSRLSVQVLFSRLKKDQQEADHFSMVGMKGLEPSRLAARAPKARVYTNFTTSPRRNRRTSFRIFASRKILQLQVASSSKIYEQDKYLSHKFC